jgi:hypothetical protein
MLLCQNCRQSLGKDSLWCGACGCPNISKVVPRRVRFKSTAKNWLAVAVGLLLPAAMSLFIFFYVGGALLVGSFGTPATATLESFSRHSGSKGTHYGALLSFVDAQGATRTAEVRSNGAEFAAQPVGQQAEIRYLGFLPQVVRDQEANAGFNKAVSWAMLVIAILLPLTFIRQFIKMRRLLISGTVRSAKVRQVFRGKAPTAEIEFKSGGLELTRKITVGSADVGAGAEIWILDDGSEGGVALFSQAFLWECV